MTREQRLPMLMIIISIGCAIGYIGEDTRKVIYWIAAAVLTATVTF